MSVRVSELVLPLANDYFQRTVQPKVFDDSTADCEPLNTKILCCLNEIDTEEGLRLLIRRRIAGRP